MIDHAGGLFHTRRTILANRHQVFRQADTLSGANALQAFTKSFSNSHCHTLASQSGKLPSQVIDGGIPDAEIAQVINPPMMVSRYHVRCIGS